MPRKTANSAMAAVPPPTTAAQLAPLIKSARDIMRKDKGLNGDLDRLPMLTWIMFLKFLDDLELQRRDEAALAGRKFRPAIEPPHRWRDWAEKADGVTGDELLAFVNQDECVRPDGSRGPGLFAYLRGISSANGDTRRDVVATVFRGVDNRMRSGYLLRDVINKINEVHFTSSEELHTLGHLYESMLREMRDAAGDSGEFYTPRAVVRFMVEMANPQLHEAILDPACGTGGFLVEAFLHLEKQVKTVSDRKILQTESIRGFEAKPLPFLLCQMNLLLHGLESPEIDPGNALRFPLSQIGDRDRVDVILTNPPFGGEEERGILSNFPEDKQTTETALLFLQLIMRRLRRVGSGAAGGRCAMVVSDGFLSTRGVAARVKEQLLNEFNLHTIVRLPRGVFVPYTPIATNLLFFDRTGSTKDVWYFEVPGPTDRQTYSKTKPFRYEEFEPCIAWWKHRAESLHAWKVSRDTLGQRDFDLDVPNPSTPEALITRDPKLALRSLCETAEGALTLARELEHTLSVELVDQAGQAPIMPLARFMTLRRDQTVIDDTTDYKLLTVQLHARGIRARETRPGRDIKTKKQQVVRAGDFIVAEIDAKLGGFGLAPEEAAGAIVSSHYFIYELDESIMLPKYFEWWLRSGIPEERIQPYVKGSTNYAAIRQQHFPLLEMPVPDVSVQKKFIEHLEQLQHRVSKLTDTHRIIGSEVEGFLPSLLGKAFGSGNQPSNQSGSSSEGHIKD